MRDLRLLAALFGLEAVMFLVAGLLFSTAEGTLLEGADGLVYYALAAMLIFVI